MIMSRVWKEREKQIMSVSQSFSSVFSIDYLIDIINVLFYVNRWTLLSLPVDIFSDIPPNQTVHTHRPAHPPPKPQNPIELSLI